MPKDSNFSQTILKLASRGTASSAPGKYAVAAQPTSLLADLIGEGMADAFEQVPIYQVCQRQQVASNATI